MDVVWEGMRGGEKIPPPPPLTDSTSTRKQWAACQRESIMNEELLSWSFSGQSQRGAWRGTVAQPTSARGILAVPGGAGSSGLKPLTWVGKKWGFREGKPREKIGYNRVITWVRTPLLIRHNAVTNVVTPKQRGNENFDRGKNYLMWGGQ